MLDLEMRTHYLCFVCVAKYVVSLVSRSLQRAIIVFILFFSNVLSCLHFVIRATSLLGNSVFVCEFVCVLTTKHSQIPMKSKSSRIERGA